MKIIFNNILRLFGYQISRFDNSGYKYRETLGKFIDSHQPYGKILDIGSSRESYVKDHYSNVTTLDIEPPADLVADVMAIPLPDSSIDTVCCFETLEHVKNPFKAMEEIYRVLKPGGLFLGSAPFSYELHGEEYGDYWRITRQGWEELLKKFESVQTAPYSGRPNIPGWYMVAAKKSL